MMSFTRFFNSEENFDVMLDKIREMMPRLPPDIIAVVRHCCLTRLRSGDALESAELINESEETFAYYYDSAAMTLNHYKFSEIFLRTTKKARLSYISPSNHSRSGIWAVELEYNAIRLTVKRRGLDMSMRHCPKLFSSWLYQSGILEITINFLSGACLAPRP
jgi:hypothetical protein